jgi:3-hydroxyacyl-[acyl-carrier-protein] dehydratase
MKSRNDFFYIRSITPDSDTSENPLHYIAHITVNPSHPIFDGHFPGTPVMPGVCQIEIVKKVLAEIRGREVFLSSAKNIKFISLIDPRRIMALDLDLTVTDAGEDIRVKAVLSAGETRFLQFNGRFREWVD